jgi:hypothetical protein
MTLPLVSSNFEGEDKSAGFLSPTCCCEAGKPGAEEDHGGWLGDGRRIRKIREILFIVVTQDGELGFVVKIR